MDYERDSLPVQPYVRKRPSETEGEWYARLMFGKAAKVRLAGWYLSRDTPEPFTAYEAAKAISGQFDAVVYRCVREFGEIGLFTSEINEHGVTVYRGQAHPAWPLLDAVYVRMMTLDHSESADDPATN